jgi:hypothetical protein
MKKNKVEKFISKAKKKYGNKYDYSEIEYINSTTEITILCTEHNISFKQSPSNHLRGWNGCPQCQKRQITDTESFIEKAKDIHTDKYDYSNVDYTDSKTKVKIICPDHGEFEQLPSHHIKGQTCPKCAVNSRALKHKYDTKTFIEKAKEVHGDKYDYSKVDYTSSKVKVKIICPEHGEFQQSLEKHIHRGQGCPKCVKNFKLDTNSFITKSIKKHGDKYSYDNVDYVNNTTNVIITCPEHGDFTQLPSVHLSGGGCPKCVGKNKTLEEVIQTFKSIQGDKYDYSKVTYVNNWTPIIITCREHGDFEQSYTTHIKGHGCPRCVGRLKTNADVIPEFKKVHGDKYDYSLVEYTKSADKVTILCPIHGKFEQCPTSHMIGSGCPSCKFDKISALKTKDISTFIEESKNMHGDKYDYSDVDYINCKKHVNIICPEHGSFLQIPDSHIRGNGCPKCGQKYNYSQIELTEYIKSLGFDVTENDKNVISPLELDLYIPSKNIAIEFDGIYWHSELYKPDDYHINKTNQCEAKGIRLIHIFEDEWKHKKDIVKSRLKNILGVTDNKIYARNCEIRLMTNDERNIFLENNHLQGSVKSSINICLTYKGEIVSSMHFNKPRLGVGSSGEHYELSRFCNKMDTSVIGGASKLLKFFYKTYGQIKLISYADKRWSEGSIYDTLGFTQTRVNKPNYWYVINNKRVHRFNFRKSMLRKEGFDTTNSTEREIMLSRGIYRIYDCGTITYEKSPE